jgi:hypothetical protein
MTYSEEDNQRPVSGGFTRGELEALPADVARLVLLGRMTKGQWDAMQAAAAQAPAGRVITTEYDGGGASIKFVPDSSPSTSQDPYAVTAWGVDEEDFVTPSGQRCRLRRLDEQMLLDAGILDQVTRLPGLVVAGPIRQAQGQPPTDAMQDILKKPDQLRDLLGVMNKLVCIVVVKPELVMEVPEGGLKPGQVPVSNVGLGDRVAIMEKVLGGVRKLDSFREGPE